MKKFIAISLLASFSASIYANTAASVFKKSTPIPHYLQNEVIQSLLAQYPCINSYGVSEVKTSMTERVLGQGQSETFYTTTLNVNFIYDYHPRTVSVNVVSSEFKHAKEQLEFFQVESIEESVYCD